MGRMVKDTGGGDFKKVPQGTHMAVCNMVAVLDGQKSSWQGQEKIVDQIYIRWEVPGERIEFEIDGVKKEGPMSIGKRYTNSLSEKANLRKDLQGWRGKEFTQDELNGFDIESILGKPCQIIVTHREGGNGNTYANVTGVAGWPKGVESPTAENELIYYAPEEPASYDNLADWLKKLIDEAVPVARTSEPAQATPTEDFDDDIPF